MGLFDKKPPKPAVVEIIAPAEPEPEGLVAVAPGAAPRPKQPAAGGGESEYKLAGILDRGEFRRPPRMRLETEKGVFELDDVLSLTPLEYTVLSKRHVLVPVAAL